MYLLLLFFVVLVASQEEEFFEEEEDTDLEYLHAEVLTPETFHDFLGGNPYTVVKFYAPWCPHCIHFHEDYDKVGEFFKDDEEINIAVLNCQNFGEFCSEQEVPGFPIVKLYKGVDLFYDYEFERDFDHLSYWLTRKIGDPTISVSNNEEYQQALESNSGRTFIIGSFPRKEGISYQAFQAVAKGMDEFIFIETLTEERNGIDELVEQMPHTEDRILIKRHEDGEFVQFPLEMDPEELEKTIRKEAYPVVGVIDENTFYRFYEGGLPIVALFIDFEDESRPVHLEMLERISAGFQGKLQFGYSDANVFMGQYELIGGKEEDIPGIAIMDVEEGQNYLYVATQKVIDDELEIIEWLQKVLDGEVKPHIRSEPIPETNDENVYVIVGVTYEEIVVQSERDVMILIYAPWCGHCKAMEPVYESVAEFFRPLKEDLLIAKMDGTENDPYKLDIQGFPTILFYPSGDKENPQLFDGFRTEDDLKVFVAKHAKSSLRDVKGFIGNLEEEMAKLEAFEFEL